MSKKLVVNGLFNLYYFLNKIIVENFILFYFLIYACLHGRGCIIQIAYTTDPIIINCPSLLV